MYRAVAQVVIKPNIDELGLQYTTECFTHKIQS